MISFIIPAHNEEACVGRCINAMQGAVVSTSEPHEIIVVDDASSDATSSVAVKNGARVIRAAHRQISATRNAGAREAHGEILFFVDADTLVGAGSVQSALQAIRAGAVGGGCIPQFEGRLPSWFRVIYPLFVAIIRLLRQPGGSCLFCTRVAFEAIGGFSETHYAAEDAVFVTALKRQGRFVLAPEPVITSGRNLRAHSLWTMARLLTRLALHGPDGFRDRRGLEIWYRPLRGRAK